MAGLYFFLPPSPLPLIFTNLCGHIHMAIFFCILAKHCYEWYNQSDERNRNKIKFDCFNIWICIFAFCILRRIKNKMKQVFQVQWIFSLILFFFFFLVVRFITYCMPFQKLRRYFNDRAVSFDFLFPFVELKFVFLQKIKSCLESYYLYGI